MSTRQKVRITGRVVLFALVALEVFLLVGDRSSSWGGIGIPLVIVAAFVGFVLIDGELAKRERRH